MQQIGEEIHQVTKERAFTNDDAARVARHIYESLGGPIPGKGFADVTEPDAKHVEVNVGYDTGLVAISYHIRFWREPDKHQDVYVENILLAPHNI